MTLFPSLRCVFKGELLQPSGLIQLTEYTSKLYFLAGGASIIGGIGIGMGAIPLIFCIMIIIWSIFACI